MKLALFDLDGTLTRERSAWEYIHRRLGVWEGRAEKFQEAFLRKEIPYRRFCELDAALWKGMKVSVVEGILREIPLCDGVGELVACLKGRGVRLGIISSGLSLLAEWVRGKYGFDYAVANELGTTDGVLDGSIRIHVRYDQKAKWVEEARRLFKVRRKEILAVGDSSGDITMFQRSGVSIAFNSRSPQLDETADFRAPSCDLRDLIPLLTPYLAREKGEPP